MRSTYNMLGWPTEITAPLFLLLVVLSLTPYFSGANFGFLSIPVIAPRRRRAWKWIGPVTLFVLLVGFVPVFPAPSPPSPSDPERILKEIADKIDALERRVRMLDGLDDDLSQVRALEEYYQKASASVWDTSKADMLKAKCVAVLSRLKGYDLSEEELKLATKAEKSASRTFDFFPENIYLPVRQLAESLGKRRETMQIELKGLRAKELEVLRQRGGGT